MASEKHVELDAKTQDPKYLYHLTQKYMLDYVNARGTNEDVIWYCELVLKNKKKVKRGDKEFEVLDLTPVRKAFVERFFDDNFGKANKKKDSYFDIVAKRLAELKK